MGNEIEDSFYMRQKRLRGEISDVYNYSEIPSELKVQFIQLITDALILVEGKTNGQIPEIMIKKIRNIKGVFDLVHPTRIKYQDVYLHDYWGEYCTYIMNEDEIDWIMTSFEIICNEFNKIFEQLPGEVNLLPSFPEIFDEINIKFKQHQIGYEYIRESNQFIRIDSMHLHSEVIKPVIKLLYDLNFKTVEKEFLKAYDHFRNGSYPEALVEAQKSFESTMKTIYDERGWHYKIGRISDLIQVGFDKGLIEIYWQDHFSSLRKTLESGISPTRNKYGGHGHGTEHKIIPEHLVNYILNLTASCILFLIKSHKQI